MRVGSIANKGSTVTWPISFREEPVEKQTSHGEEEKSGDDRRLAGKIKDATQRFLHDSTW
jgi:hypothetical protein